MTLNTTSSGIRIALPLAMRVVIIKHVDVEGPGLIESCLIQKKISYQVLCLESGARLPNPEEFTHIVLLGGPMNVYEEDRYPFLKQEDLFIKGIIQRGKPILGICLGAQLMAKALGAKVLNAPVREVGWYDISLTRIGSRDPLFSDLPKTFPAFQWHEDTFEIPKAGKLIATSTPIAHQAFRYGENAYGLQFHFEVTEEMITDWLQAYGVEMDGGQASPISKAQVLTETEINIETYTRRGMTFLEKFFEL